MVLQLDQTEGQKKGKCYPAMGSNGFQVLLSILAVLVVVVGKCRFLSQLSYLPRHLGGPVGLGTLFQGQQDQGGGGEARPSIPTMLHISVPSGPPRVYECRVQSIASFRLCLFKLLSISLPKTKKSKKGQLIEQQHPKKPHKSKTNHISSYLPLSVVQSATTIGLARWSNDKHANGLTTPPP